MKRGAFFLRYSSDLLFKLRHDVGRLNANHGDAYAAFDVAVTGYHLGEWVQHEGGENAGRRADRIPALDVARALANGGKHFITDRLHNDAVVDSRAVALLDVGGLGSIGGSAPANTWLEIDVGPSVGNATNIRTWVAHHWAAELLAYWESEFERYNRSPERTWASVSKHQ